MNQTLQRGFRFFKDWSLPFDMLFGVLSFFILDAWVESPRARGILLETASTLQPVLLFGMLFIAFCKIAPSDIRPRPWHLWYALLQTGVYCLLAAAVCLLPLDENGVVLAESAMVAFVCPTATAATVITERLKGDSAMVVTYTLLINLLCSLVIPAVVPFLHPAQGMGFWQAFGCIIAKVFPLLVFPLLAAWAIRRYRRRWLHYIYQVPNLAFYFWLVSLYLCMVITTRILMRSGVGVGLVAGMAAVTLAACLLQFWLGRAVAKRYAGDDPARVVAGGQLLGQKNTAFMIWMGYTFMNPVTAVAGGFYSIWHNMINSLQLARFRKSQAGKA